MKYLISTMLMGLLLLSACMQDKLDLSRANEIITNCNNKKPDRRYVVVNKTISFSSSQKTQRESNYQKLNDGGYIKLIPLKNENSLSQVKKFKVELTKKAKPFIEEIIGNNTEKIVAFEYQIGEILEFNITENNKTARVKAELVPTGISPFAVLMNGAPESKTKYFNLSNNSGRWKYCD